ncbi:peptide/nickel transport system substrate-binding protein [Methylobacterium sp. ap11]|nr:peptide/nickel transport system substrate-binding protein [Methylobacterium sp. ap11]
MRHASLSRRQWLAGASALAALGPTGTVLAQGAAPAGPAGAPSGHLTYGISLFDLPLTTGQPDRGAGGYQFTGLTLYDPLVAWELDVADRPGKLVPGLATAWESDAADRRNWIFRLREGSSSTTAQGSTPTR